MKILFLIFAMNAAAAMESVHGVPQEIIVAQAILESGWGSSRLSKSHNNYFGIKKGKKGWRSYGSVMESFDDHGKLLNASRYKHLHGCSIEDWAYGLRDSGYCPEEDYPDKLLKIINQIFPESLHGKEF